MVSRIRVGCAALLAAFVASACDTIPLTAPTGSAVTISAASSFVPAGGTTEVTAFVSEESGTAVQNGTSVRFSTNFGRMEPVEAQTKNGYAVATFIAGDSSGVADVIATSGSTGGGTTTGTGEGATTTGSNVVRITVGGAAAETVVLNASPSSVPAAGGTVTLIASVLDINGNRLRNVPINFSTTAGALSPTVATTDASGEARVQLTTSREAIVTARAASKSVTLTITVNAALQITVEPATGTTATAFNFTITPAQGSLVQSVVVDFGDGISTDLGSISSATRIGHKYEAAGTMVVRVTQTNIDGSRSSAVTAVVVTAPAPTL